MTDNPESLPFFHAAFQAGIAPERTLRINAPPEPKHLKDVKGHRFQKEFEQAMDAEYMKH